VKTVSLCRTSIIGQIWKVQKLRLGDVNRTVSTGVSKLSFLHITIPTFYGVLRPCTKKRFSQSYPGLFLMPNPIMFKLLIPDHHSVADTGDNTYKIGGKVKIL